MFKFIIDSEFYKKNKKFSILKTISSVQCQVKRNSRLKEKVIRRKTLIVKLNSALNVDYYCSERTQRISRLELLFLFSPEKLSIAINDKNKEINEKQFEIDSHVVIVKFACIKRRKKAYL